MTVRIHRGFHRIGVVLAVPVLLVACVSAGHEAWVQRTINAPDQARVEAKTNGDVVDPFAKYLPTASSKRSPFDSLAVADPARQPDYTGSLIALTAALVLYAVARAIGWILAGFLDDRHKP